jgi:hypothetical protein
MNRKLGTLIKAALFALPLALPGVALAQTADQPPTSNGTYDNADKQNAPIEDKSNLDKNVPQPESGSTGVTPDNARTPPAGSLDNSGSTKSNDNSVGGDINKTPEQMNSDTGNTTTTTTKSKKTIKKSTSDSDMNKDNSTDLNR